MKKFEKYLKLVKIVHKNKIPYYISWVSRFLAYNHKGNDDSVNPDEIDTFTHESGEKYEDWQVNQARDAIRLYLFFRTKDSQDHVPKKNEESGAEWKQATEEMVSA